MPRLDYLNKKKNFIVRADGSTKIGFGHIKRSIIMALIAQKTHNIYLASRTIPKIIRDDLKLMNFNYINLSRVKRNDENNYLKNKIKKIDTILFDGYQFMSTDEKFFKNLNIRVITIDDMADRNFNSDIIINHAPNISIKKYKKNKLNKFYLGIKFLMIPKFFYRKKIVKYKKNSLFKVFVCLGAGDLNQALLKKIIGELIKNIRVDKIFVVSNENKINFDNYNSTYRQKLFFFKNLSSIEISKLIKKSDFGICSASNISLECCVANLPIIVGYTVKNQLNIYNGIIKKKLGIGLGNLNSKSKNSIAIKIDDMTKNNRIISDLIVNQQNEIDGKSNERISKIINQ